jgi:hypothetical protein
VARRIPMSIASTNFLLTMIVFECHTEPTGFWGTGPNKTVCPCSDYPGLEDTITNCLTQASQCFTCFGSLSNCIGPLLLPGHQDLKIICRNNHEGGCGKDTVGNYDAMYAQYTTDVPPTIWICPDALAIYKSNPRLFCTMMLHELIHMCSKIMTPWDGSSHPTWSSELDAYALSNICTGTGANIWPESDGQWRAIHYDSSVFDEAAHERRGNWVIVNLDTGEVWCIDWSSGEPKRGRSLGTFEKMKHDWTLPKLNT